jgi:HipA-like protein
MATEALDVLLGDRKVGAIIGLGGDRTVFTFDDAYADDPARPTLSLSFKDAMGDLIRDQKRTQTQLSPFFSNLLPEGPLRDYLAKRAGVKAARGHCCPPVRWRKSGVGTARRLSLHAGASCHNSAAVFTGWRPTQVFRARKG